MKKLKKFILNFILFSPFSVVLADHSKSSKILDILSEHNNWTIRSSVASNKWVSIKTLKKLAADSDWFVRHSAISNSKSTEEVLLYYRAYLWNKKCNNSFCLENM